MGSGRRGRRPAPARSSTPSTSTSCFRSVSASSPGRSAPRRWTRRSARRRSLLRSRSASWRPSRFGIPAPWPTRSASPGFAAWGATAYPVPLAWGASFDPELVERMARRIGADMRRVGVHQGLAPVLDVVRDSRWGRVEETIGEDPYLVGTVGTAYVRGLESPGSSRRSSTSSGTRPRGPGATSPRSRGRARARRRAAAAVRDGVRDGGPRSVMNSYTEIDGVPVAADRELLTGLLRDTWGFDGTVVADYFGVAFLQAPARHGRRPRPTPPARRWRPASTSSCRPWTLLRRAARDAVRAGASTRSLVDRGAAAGAAAEGRAGPARRLVVRRADRRAATVDLDPPANRALARELAEESVVLLANDGTLPLGPRSDRGDRAARRRPAAMLGCYSFPTTCAQHPGSASASRSRPLLEALRAEFPAARSGVRRLRGRRRGDRSGFAAAVRPRASADIVVLVGSATAPGCSAGARRARAATRGPRAARGAGELARGGAGHRHADGARRCSPAARTRSACRGRLRGHRAGVLPGRGGRPGDRRRADRAGEPQRAAAGERPGDSRRAADELPRAAARPRTDVSNIDPTAAFPFGHGLGYTVRLGVLQGGRRDRDRHRRRASTAAAPCATPATGRAPTSCSSTCTTRWPRSCARCSASSDTPASNWSPASRPSRFAVPADLAAFTGRDGERIVEPGAIVLSVGRSSADLPFSHTVQLRGQPVGSTTRGVCVPRPWQRAVDTGALMGRYRNPGSTRMPPGPQYLPGG